MDVKDMQEFLTANNERIKEAAVEAVIMRLRENIRYGLPDDVQAVINDFMRAEVAPAVVVALKNERDGIVAAAAKAAADIGDALAKVMVENAVKSMTGYRGAEIIKTLMQG